MKRVCVVCGKEFETTHGTKLTCSLACSDERNRQVARERKRNARLGKTRQAQVETCRMCGNSFVVTVTNQKYCPTCRVERLRYMDNKEVREFYKNRSPAYKVCVVCGKEFETKDYRRNTCSVECKVEHRKTYGKEYKRAERMTVKDKFFEAYNRCPEDPRKLDKTLEKLKQEGKSYAEAQKAETIKMYARVIP